MNPTIIQIIETNIIGQLSQASTHTIDIPPLAIASPPGIGKTATIKTIAESLDMNLVHMSIPEVSTENLSGIPDFVDAPDMTKYSQYSSSETKATIWSVPQIIESANRLAQEREGCILFIDDLHRVNMAVAPYLYGLLGERKLGQYQLDPKVSIIGAMNDSDEAGFSGIDSPIKDRISILPVKFDFEYWFKNFGSKLHYYASSFLKIHPAYAQEDETTEIEQFGTPRSWTHLANELELFPPEFIQEHAQLLATQKVSIAAAQEFDKHIQYIEAIDFSAKIKAKAPIAIHQLKSLDQILYAYIVNYVHSFEDANYVVDLIDTNIESSNFIGFVVGELYTKFQVASSGKEITPGVQLLVNTLLQKPFAKADYKSVTEKQQKIAENLSFKHHQKLFELASEFIN